MLSSQAGCRVFLYDEIKTGTKNFDDSNLIGSGGEAMVYKGTLSDGRNIKISVAVKCLKINSDEFTKEMKLLSNLHHANLISLIGYCQQNESNILVYELMVNGSLHQNIYKRGGCSLSWDQRLKICIGAARGLDYLHTGTSNEFKIIHRDVKPANILLDANYYPKISDFGLARRGPANQTRSAVSTAVKGTVGYYAPECFTTGQITVKVDVYAFGVVLYEVLCRKKPWERFRDDSNVVDQSEGQWAYENIDKFLDGKILGRCFDVFVDIAKKCVNKDPFQRPTMSDVVSNLENALKLQESDSKAGKSPMLLPKISEPERVTGSSKSTKFENTSEKHEHGFGSSKASRYAKILQRSELRTTESGTATKSGSSQPARREGTLQHSIGRTESSKSGDTSSRTKSKVEIRSSKSLPMSQDRKIHEDVSSSGKRAELTYKTKSGGSMTPSRSTLLDMPSTKRKIVLYASVQTHTDCHKIRSCLNIYKVAIEERDPTNNQTYDAELHGFFSRTGRQYSLPQLFIGGKYVGGAGEVDRLYRSGQLRELLSQVNQV